MEPKLENPRIVIWKDPRKDEGRDVQDKSQALVDFVETFGLTVTDRYDHMPLISVRGTVEQLEALEMSGLVIVEKDGKVHTCTGTNLKGRPPNCS